ncbi:LBL_2463 family protein, partial [Leptospira interrogans]
NNLIPLELGIIKDTEPYQRYAVIGDNIADWNSVSFLLNKKAMFAAVCVFHAAAQFCLDKNFEIVYGFYHKKVSSIVKLYNSIGAIPSKKYEKEVYFPECYYNGELVYLTPIEISKDALQKIKTRLW